MKGKSILYGGIALVYGILPFAIDGFKIPTKVETSKGKYAVVEKEDKRVVRQIDAGLPAVIREFHDDGKDGLDYMLTGTAGTRFLTGRVERAEPSEEESEEYRRIIESL